MQLPTPLSRQNKKAHKNTFGHVLIIAGSRRMLGAGALSALSAMRSGAGLVTLGVPESLNAAAQKKISNVIMTFPLPETKEGTLSYKALNDILDFSASCDAVAIGPGLTTEKSTKRLVKALATKLKAPLVIDADGLNIISECPEILLKTNIQKILTPHPGEMSRLAKASKKMIEGSRKTSAEEFSKQYNCVLVLKGAGTVVASKGKRTYINKTGNPGMATAGSGDVLTGMIAAFIAQGLNAFDAAKFGAYLHGKAGGLAAKKNTKTAMIASDIINFIPEAFKKAQ